MPHCRQCWHPLCCTIETPTEWRGGCSRIVGMQHCRHALCSPIETPGRARGGVQQLDSIGTGQGAAGAGAERRPPQAGRVRCVCTQ